MEFHAPPELAGRKTPLRSYRELVAWQKAVAFVIGVYSLTKEFPRDEIYGLTSQLRRSAVSVPSNIAEGQGRATKGEFIQFLCHARGSLFELETQIVIAHAVGYITPAPSDSAPWRSAGGRIWRSSVFAP